MSTVPEVPATAPEGPNFFQKNKLWFILAGLFLLSNFSVYFYQRYQYNSLLKNCREVLDKNYETAQELNLLRSEEMANNLCRTMVFGIRGEMERGNKADIELFINRMVQESGIDLVIIQNVQDSIYLSSDKKFENQRVPYIQGAISAQQILQSDLEGAVVAAPIMGTEQRLGTLLIKYKAPTAADVLIERIKVDSLPGEKIEKGK